MHYWIAERCKRVSSIREGNDACQRFRVQEVLSKARSLQDPKVVVESTNGWVSVRGLVVPMGGYTTMASVYDLGISQ